MYFKSLLIVVCLCLGFFIKTNQQTKTSVTDTELGGFALTLWQQTSHNVCASYPSSRPRVQSLQPSVASPDCQFLGKWADVYMTRGVLQTEWPWGFRCNWGVKRQTELDHNRTNYKDSQLLWTTAHFVVAAAEATAQEEWLQINRITEAEKLQGNRGEKHLRSQKSLVIHVIYTWKFSFNVFVY